jgi:tRNA 2-thiouridine synthesizing protein A
MRLLSLSEETLLSFFLGSVDAGVAMKVKPDRTLDCLGLYCPEPVFKTRLELDDLRVGEVLEVLADDPAAESDIRSLVKNLEQELVNVSKEGDSVRILIRKVK